MLHYFILLAYILVVCIIPMKNNRAKLLLCFVPFTLFFGSRLEWTSDYFNYEELFNKIHDNKMYLFEINISEIGFELFCAILPSYRSLIWVVTILYSLSLFMLFEKYIVSKYWPMAFLLLFINHQLLLGTISAIRSCIVASIFIFAIHAKLKNVKILPYLLLLIAFLFHRSAVLLFIILIPERFKHSLVLKKMMFFLIFVSIFISFVNPDFWGSKLIGILESNRSFESYSGYITSESQSIFFYINVIVNIFFIITNVYLLNKSKNYAMWLFLSIVYFTIISIPNIGMVSRFTSYFGPALLVGLSAWSEIGVKYQLLKYTYFSILVASTLYFFVSDFPQYSGFYLYRNYNSIFFQ